MVKLTLSSVLRNIRKKWLALTVQRHPGRWKDSNSPQPTRWCTRADVDVRPGARRGVGHGGSVEGDLHGLGASRDRLDWDCIVRADGHVLARHQVRDAAHRQRVGRAEAGKLAVDDGIFAASCAAVVVSPASYRLTYVCGFHQLASTVCV